MKKKNGLEEKRIMGYKKILILVFALISISWLYEPGEGSFEEQMISVTLPHYQGVFKKEVSSNEYGIRHEIDSLNYSIIRRWTHTGIPIIDHISNNYTHIDLIRTFEEDGKLKTEGFMTTTNHTLLGEWFGAEHNYVHNNKLYSHYDSLYRVPFQTFYELSDSLGLVDSTTYFSFNLNSMKWKVQQFRSSSKNSTNYNCLTLQVDSMFIEKPICVDIH